MTVTVTCPKCGGSDLHTRFFAETDPDRLHVGFLGLSDSSGLHGCYRRDEHLHRTCQTCGYWWAEDCADAKPPTVSPPVITPVITPRIGNDLANKTTDSPFAPTSSAECHAEL